MIVNARSEDALERLAEELRATYGVRVDCIAAGLSTSDGCRVLIDAVGSRDIDAAPAAAPLVPITVAVVMLIAGGILWKRQKRPWRFLASALMTVMSNRVARYLS